MKIQLFYFYLIFGNFGKLINQESHDRRTMRSSSFDLSGMLETFNAQESIRLNEDKRFGHYNLPNFSHLQFKPIEGFCNSPIFFLFIYCTEEYYQRISNSGNLKGKKILSAFITLKDHIKHSINLKIHQQDICIKN